MLAARMGIQAVVLFSVARFIAADGYGTFAAVVALGSLFAPLSGLGADFVAMRAAAQTPAQSLVAFNRALRITTATTVPLVIVAAAISNAAFSEHIALLIALQVLVADIFMFRISELVAKIYQGRGDMFVMGIVRLLPALLRLVAVGALWLLAAAPTLALWATCYLSGSVAAALLASAWLFRDLRHTLPMGSPLPFRWKDGLHFAGGVISARLHTEADKMLVLSLSGATGAGVYAAGYRIIELSLLPVAAIVSTAYARLFGSAGTHGTAATAAAGIRSTAACVMLGLVLAAAVWGFLVPALVWSAGPSFATVNEGLLPLAMLPIAMSLRMTGEQNVAAAGFLAIRSRVQWVVAGGALVANFICIPRYGWTAAAYVCMATETTLGLIYLGVMAKVASKRISTI